MKRSAMDPAKEYSWLSVTVGFILLFVWSVMSLGHAYDRRLAEANESFTGAFRVVGRLDMIAVALDHLGVDQQAFLSTGEERFQDGVVENIQTLELGIDALNSLAARSTSRRALLVGLSRSIERIIASAAESDRIRETGNSAAAAAFFESREAEITQAKSQIAQLRLETLVSISDGIWNARDETLLAALLDDVRRWQHAALSNSAISPNVQERFAILGCIPEKKRAEGPGRQVAGPHHKRLFLRNVPFHAKGIG